MSAASGAASGTTVQPASRSGWHTRSVASAWIQLSYSTVSRMLELYTLCSQLIWKIFQSSAELNNVNNNLPSTIKLEEKLLGVIGGCMFASFNNFRQLLPEVCPSLKSVPPVCQPPLTTVSHAQPLNTSTIRPPLPALSTALLPTMPVAPNASPVLLPVWPVTPLLTPASLVSTASSVSKEVASHPVPKVTPIRQAPANLVVPTAWSAIALAV